MAVLILKSDKTDFEEFYLQHMQKDEVDTYPIYNVKRGILWKIAVAWIEKLGLYGRIFYSEWKCRILSYDTVIVFDRNLNWNVFKYIKRRNPKARCIAWYWNSINDNVREFPRKLRNLCEVWSFDQNDCQKFGYKKNVQFYFNNIELTNMRQVEYDALFIGIDKGRYALLKEISDCMADYGKKAYIGIVADKNSSAEGNYVDYVDYQSILNMISKCSCIIDVPKRDQEGITLRVLEAMYFEKKLITTNSNIVHYDFYNEANIFVWNLDNKDCLLSFLDKQMKNVPDNLKYKYSFYGWLEKFGL